MKAGVPPGELDSRFLNLQDARGRVVDVSRNPPNWDKVEAMMEDNRSFPIKVKYRPPKYFHSMSYDSKAAWEMNTFFMQWIRETVESEDSPTVHTVRNLHQRYAFERYQLYILDEDTYTRKNLSLEEYGARYPAHVGGMFMILKTGPQLKKIFKGEED